jgi:hypothetical protein
LSNSKGKRFDLLNVTVYLPVEISGSYRAGRKYRKSPKEVIITKYMGRNARVLEIKL